MKAKNILYCGLIDWSIDSSVNGLIFVILIILLEKALFFRPPYTRRCSCEVWYLSQDRFPCIQTEPTFDPLFFFIGGILFSTAEQTFLNCSPRDFYFKRTARSLESLVPSQTKTESGSDRFCEAVAKVKLEFSHLYFRSEMNWTLSVKRKFGDSQASVPIEQLSLWSKTLRTRTTQTGKTSENCI